MDFILCASKILKKCHFGATVRVFYIQNSKYTRLATWYLSKIRLFMFVITLHLHSPISDNFTQIKPSQSRYDGFDTLTIMGIV